jgi:predicted ferric reductase
MEHLAWYVSRSTGIVGWGLLVASMLWGLLHATRLLGRRARPWWMLGVHRFLGALAVAFVIVHVLALIADGYTSFGIVDVLVPLASEWKPIPVALGVVGFYVLLAVELTSLAQRHLPRAVWRQVHLASYGVFAFATLHALAAGTDVRDLLVGGLALGVGVVVALLSALTWIARAAPKEVGGAASASVAAGLPGAFPPRRSVPFGR